MKKLYWIILFFIVLTGELIAVALNNELLQTIFKPLLLLVLFIYFSSATKSLNPALRKRIKGALFFSWLGDVLLLFQERDSRFFLLGLVAFLLAHLFYISFFHRIRNTENIQSRGWLLPIVAAYYAALIALLYPYLGDMKIPVPIYGLVISFMLLLALHILFIKNKMAGRLLAAGAVLFVISDSVLAINKFFEPFSSASFIIMLTYGLAQLILVQGAIHYIRERKD